MTAVLLLVVVVVGKMIFLCECSYWAVTLTLRVTAATATAAGTTVTTIVTVTAVRRRGAFILLLDMFCIEFHHCFEINK